VSAQRPGPAGGLRDRLRSAAVRVARWVWHLPQQLLMLVVRGYRLLLKPWLGSACRFEPTCSAYTLQALQQHGAVRGTALGTWRLLRCHPWCDGGCDPVPDTFAPWPGRRTATPPGLPAAAPEGDPARPAGAPGLFTRLLPRAPDPGTQRRPESSERPLP
jgi:putative membrane protein insertion efficiency factor